MLMVLDDLLIILLYWIGSVGELLSMTARWIQNS